MSVPIFSDLDEVHLEAEVASRMVERFVGRYQRITGVRPNPGVDFQIQSKHGLEGRIYFNATNDQVNSLRRMGFRVQGPRTKGYLSSTYAYRIDKNSLFWDLISDGHRI